MSTGIIILLYVGIAVAMLIVGIAIGKEVLEDKHRKELQDEVEAHRKKVAELHARHAIQVAKVNELEARLKKENANGS